MSIQQVRNERQAGEIVRGLKPGESVSVSLPEGIGVTPTKATRKADMSLALEDHYGNHMGYIEDHELAAHLAEIRHVSLRR